MKQNRFSAVGIFLAVFGAWIILGGAFAIEKLDNQRQRALNLANEAQSLTERAINLIDEYRAFMPDPHEWQIFVEALIFVESSGETDAVGDGGDAVGILQIHSKVVDDCNRILGRNEFTLNDRLSQERSIMMFNVIQAHYNPERDIHLAMKCWNSRAPIAYHRAVIDKMNELKQSTYGR